VKQCRAEPHQRQDDAHHHACRPEGSPLPVPAPASENITSANEVGGAEASSLGVGTTDGTDEGMEVGVEDGITVGTTVNTRGAKEEIIDAVIVDISRTY
jgi:hypothetical protein